MRTIDLCAAVALCIVPSSQLAADEVSVERGLYISIIGGCHFCHTEGYREAEGKIDPEKALKGSSVGWRGPWGTTYAANLRDLAMGFNEDKWVDHLKNNDQFAADALVPSPSHERKRLAFGVSLHQIARATRRVGTVLPGARQGAEDTLRHTRATSDAEEEEVTTNAPGPKGQKRPADVIGNAVRVMRSATGEEVDDTQDDGVKAAKVLCAKGGKKRAENMKSRTAGGNCPKSGQG